MNEPDVVAMLHGWIDQSCLPPGIPTDHVAICAVLETCKAVILHALDHGEGMLAERGDRLAWMLATQHADPELLALAHWCRGLLMLNRTPRPALEHFEQALAFYRAAQREAEQGRLLICCAGLLGQLGHLTAADYAISEAARILVAFPAYHDRLPALLINRSDIEGRLGRYAAMQATAQEAERLACQYDQPAAQAEAVMNQAFAALFLGDVAHAEPLLHQAEEIAHACGSADLALRAAVNRSRLAVYRGDLFAALRMLQQAADALADDLVDEACDIDRATIALEEAALCERLHMPAEALKLARSAAAGFAAVELLTESCEAALLATRLALDLGNVSAARRDLDQAMTLAHQTTLAPVMLALLAAYAAHPQFQRSAADRQAALQRADDAIATLRGLSVPYDTLQTALIAARLAASLRQPEAATRYQMIIDQAQQYGFPLIEQQAWEGLASSMRPARAWQPLQRAADLAAQIRQDMPIEELKAHYLHGLAPLTGRLVAAYLKHKQPVLAVQALLNAGGSIWADTALPADPVPLDPAWLRVKTAAQYWQDYQRQASDPDELAFARERVQQAEAEVTRLARRHVRQRPPHTLPDVPTIQACLAPSDVALAYLLHDGTISACVITRDAPPSWTTLGSVVALERALGRFGLLRMTLQQRSSHTQRRQVAEQQSAAAEKLLAELYQILLAPIEQQVTGTRLLIAPDGLLFDLPWAALWHGHGYAADRWELGLLPSLAVLALPRTDAPAGAPLLLGYAGDPPLQYLDQEFLALQQIFPQARAINPATTADVRREIAPAFLHITAHGQINPRTPLLSGLHLADGVFTLAEAFNLPLHGTALVTLSACDTGVTPEHGGIALALAGAFLCAGAQAVVASLWPVDDQATGLLMAQLYAGLNMGMTIPAAMRQAQAHLRAAGYRHPYYWAAFQPILRGMPVPIQSTHVG